MVPRASLLVRTLALTLAVLLAVGPARAKDAARAAANAGGSLSVETDPVGAAVYVDGRLAGATPVNLAGLASGEHRVRVVKSGYLENARLITVATGKPAIVKVKLTRSGETPSDAGQVVTNTGGGGSKKLLWIALIGAGAAAGIVAALPKNKPPVPGTITVSPNETGLAAATNFSFTAQGASDPNGDPLTFSWDFGDGASGTGSPATHTYATAGTRTVRLTVSDGKASETATGSVSVRDLTGTFSGTMSVSTFTPILTQNGAAVTGTYTGTFSCPNNTSGSGTVTGSVVPPKNVQLTVGSPGCNNITLTGAADSSVNVLSGTQASGGFGNLLWTVTRR